MPGGRAGESPGKAIDLGRFAVIFAAFQPLESRFRSPARGSSMHAVIRTGGKQYRVAQSDVIFVEKLAGEAGETIELGEVLMLGDGAEATAGTPLVEGARVMATIVEQTRGKKILVFKKKRRKNYRRTRGHRQDLTVLRIDDILAAGAKPQVKAKAAEPAAKAPDKAPDKAKTEPKAKAAAKPRADAEKSPAKAEPKAKKAEPKAKKAEPAGARETAKKAPAKAKAPTKAKSAAKAKGEKASTRTAKPAKSKTPGARKPGKKSS